MGFESQGNQRTDKNVYLEYNTSSKCNANVNTGHDPDGYYGANLKSDVTKLLYSLFEKKRKVT